MNNPTFLPADLYLPQNSNLQTWAVLACDQFINQEDYWQNVEDTVGRDASSLRLTLPESCLDGPDIESDIMSINNTMSHYLRENIFKKYENSMILVRRTLPNGTVRHGIVGMLDLEEFDYSITSKNLVRASETILLPRIPPRVATRKNAPLEVSHVILLADDHENTIFSEINTEKLEKLYDFSLMAEGGHLSGWILGEQEKTAVETAVKQFSDQAYFHEKYQNQGEILQFALGDGNHSLATAKECYERQKKFVHPEDWANLPARYALVELVNLHEESVVLQPFHQVISAVDPLEFLRDFRTFVENFPQTSEKQQDFNFYFQGRNSLLTVSNPISSMEIRTFDAFLNHWLPSHPNATVQYLQSQQEAEKLAVKHNTICIILPELNKNNLFPSLISEGILPKKTFALGEPRDKKYYLEARKIR